MLYTYIYVCSLGFLLNCQFIFCHVLLTWVMRWCAPLDALPWSTSKTKSLWHDKYMKAYEQWVASPLDIGGLITIRVSKHSCHICHIFCCMFIEHLLYIYIFFFKLNLYSQPSRYPPPSTPSTLPGDSAAAALWSPGPAKLETAAAKRVQKHLQYDPLLVLVDETVPRLLVCWGWL